MAETALRELDTVRQYIAALAQALTSSGQAPDSKSQRIALELDRILDKLTTVEDEQLTQRNLIDHARESGEAYLVRYQDLFEFSPDGYLITDLNNIIREANGACETLFRCQVETLLGCPLSSRIAAQNHSTFYDVTTRARLQADLNQITDWEMHLKPFRGPPLPVSVKVAVIRDREEQPIGMRWLIRDLTAQNQAERTLRQERDFAETLVQSARAAVLTVDRNGCILRCNTFTSELLGYLAHELRGHGWSSVIIPEENQLQAARWFQRVVAEGSAPPIVQRIVDRSDNERLLEWSGIVLPEYDGTISGVLLVGYDITQMEQAQARALQAERLAAIGQMVTGLAHESRNALQRSQACLEMLRLEVKRQPKALELIGRLQDAQDHLQQLYEEVRQFAVPIQLKRQPSAPRAVWRRAWDSLESARAGRDAKLVEAAGADLRCPMDPFRIEQVFRNILDNALAACQDPVEITVRCGPAELRGRPAVEVSFHDNGLGLSPEQRRRVFEPFYTTKIRGTGLGMPIARRIVEAHEGVIRVGGTRGRGAEFIVTLPQEETHETHVPDRGGG